jgi:hypothetical protein
MHYTPSYQHKIGTLYLFLDESGNFDFSPKGTKYFILTALATFDPLSDREKLIKLRYEQLSAGIDQEYFHATEDLQRTRDSVFEIISKLSNTTEIHAVVAQKNKVYPTLYKESYFKGTRQISRITGSGLYQKMNETLLKYVFQGKGRSVDKIVIVIGSLFVGEKKSLVTKTLKQYLKRNFPDVPFEIYSHSACADLNCQLADYCCWALAVRKERGENRPYEIIQKMIKSEFDIFQLGKTEYYSYN